MKTRDKAKTAPLVPARAIQGADALKVSFNWLLAEASIWTDRMVSALVNGVKGGKWFSVMDKVYALRTLEAAWGRVRANKGAAGVDGQSVERFESRAGEYLAELGAALRDGSYRPEAVKRVEIPKGDGRTRPLGIPTVRDRIAQTAVKMAIEPVFETAFCEGSAACPGEGRGLSSGARLQGRVARGGPAVERRLLLCGGCGYQELLRHDSA